MLIAASVLLVPAAAFVGVLRRWRLCLISLGLLYALVATIEGLSIGPVFALSQVVAGATTLIILFTSARQVFSETHTYVIHGRLPAWEYLFETVVAAVGAVGAGLFARAHPLFGLAGPVSFSWAWLGLAGLFMIVLASNVLEVTLGLLVFDAGLNLLVLTTSAAEWWLALMVVQTLPIALALALSITSLKLSHAGQGVGLDVLREKAPFVMAGARPVRIRVRARSSRAPQRTES